MKKDFLKTMLWMLCAVFTLSACSDDDGDKGPGTVIPIDTDLAGEYKGALNVEMAGQELAKDLPKNITLSKAGDEAINLLLADFKLDALELGDIKLENLALTPKGGNVYTFSGSQKTTLPTVGECDITATGECGNAEVSVDLNIVWNNIPITVSYKGKKLSGSESAANALVSFWFDPSNPKNAIVTDQDGMELGEGQTEIHFAVDENATAEQLAALEPTVQVSEKASYVLSGTDYSSDVTVTVVAENGAAAVYTVKAPTVRTSAMKFTFDEWTEGSSMGQMFPTPSDDRLATSNGGAVFFNGQEPKLGYPVLQETPGFGEAGSAAKLVTLNSSTNPALGKMAPITAGSLFTGKFVFNFGDLANPLRMTKFGIAYTQKPLLFKFVYKYTPGTNYIDGSNKDNIQSGLDIKDECSIQAVLYQVEDDSETLTGEDINTSDKRVAVAQLFSGEVKEWTAKTIEFTYLEGKSYDPTKKYKMAVVCSSSKDGDKFMGAENSTLLIDDIEVVGEVTDAATSAK